MVKYLLDILMMQLLILILAQILPLNLKSASKLKQCNRLLVAQVDTISK